MTSKSKKKGAMQAVAHLVQLNATNTETDRHSFLDRPAKTNVDISRVTDVRAFDRADTELTAARAWPKGLSEERKKNAVRIYFLQTNEEQARECFRNVTSTYVHDSLDKETAVSADHPYLKEYLVADPTGEKPFAVSDAQIFKNASKLASATAEPSDPSSADASSTYEGLS